MFYSSFPLTRFSLLPLFRRSTASATACAMPRKRRQPPLPPEPLDHPVFATMSLRELADLPMPRPAPRA